MKIFEEIRRAVEVEPTEIEEYESMMRYNSPWRQSEPCEYDFGDMFEGVIDAIREGK